MSGISNIDTIGKITHFKGNLLDFPADFLAQQCNCVSTRSLGLSESLFAKYPYANIYKNRFNGKYDQPGTIRVCGNGKDKRFIINMMAQYYPGESRWEDTRANRLKWFQECLNQISELENIEKASIAFPYGIGCGLAGGNWQDYETLLQKWAEKTKLTVFIVKLEMLDDIKH